MIFSRDEADKGDHTIFTGLWHPLARGTWQYNDSVAEDTVIAAVHAGFVHIDTAYDYHNQAAVSSVAMHCDHV